jgi:hypothetical protein
MAKGEGRGGLNSRKSLISKKVSDSFSYFWVFFGQDGQDFSERARVHPGCKKSHLNPIYRTLSQAIAPCYGENCQARRNILFFIKGFFSLFSSFSFVFLSLP